MVRGCGSDLVLGRCAIVSYDFLVLKLREIVIHPRGEVGGKRSVLSTFLNPQSLYIYGGGHGG